MNFNKLAILLLGTGFLTHCSGAIDLGSTHDKGSGASGASAGSAGSSGGGASGSSGEATSGSSGSSGSGSSGSPVEGADGGADATPPNGCGVCTALTIAPNPVSAVSQLNGIWSLCAGQIVLQTGPGTGGFPADTVGMDLEDGTAYLLVQGDGGLTRGLGLQYVWSVSLNSPISSSSGSEAVLNFSNSYTNGLLGYAVTLIPGTGSCGTTMHFTCTTSGELPYQSDFLAITQ